MTDIGVIGERWFALACSQENIQAHSPYKDINGWDFHLEHPTNRPEQTGLIKTFVQVKTTLRSERTPRFDLSALMRLVYTDQPCFVVHLHCVNQEIERCTLYHIDATIVEWALRKERNARKLNKALNKVKVDLNRKWGRVIEGKVFNETIMSAIDEHQSPSIYALAKNVHRTSCGYAGITKVTKWLGKGGNSIDSNQIETIQAIIPSKEVTFTQPRFEVELPHDAVTMHDITLAVERIPTGFATLRIDSADKTSIFHGTPYYDTWKSGVLKRVYQTAILRFEHDVDDQPELSLSLNFQSRTKTSFLELRKNLTALSHAWGSDQASAITFSTEDFTSYSEGLWGHGASDDCNNFHYLLHYFAAIFAVAMENELGILTFDTTPHEFHRLFMKNITDLWKGVCITEIGNLDELGGAVPTVGGFFVRHGLIDLGEWEVEIEWHCEVQSVNLTNEEYDAVLNAPKLVSFATRRKVGEIEHVFMMPRQDEIEATPHLVLVADCTLD